MVEMLLLIEILIQNQWDFLFDLHLVCPLNEIHVGTKISHNDDVNRP